MAFWLILVIILGVTTVGSALLGLAIARAIHEAKQGSQPAEVKPKRKRLEETPFVERLAEEGAVWLEDDGALPELVEADLYLADKPKRTLDGDQPAARGR